jgi:SAM-dependent methyltransferase
VTETRPDLHAIQSFYDAEARRYYSSRYEGSSADAEVWRARADLVLELVGQVDGVALDLGCGPGVLAPRLASRVGRLCCADLSLEMLLAGRDALGTRDGVHWINCDLGALPLADGTIDALLVVGVFGLASDPGGTIAEFARVLRPRGRLILQVPNAWSPRRHAERLGRRLAPKAAYERRLAGGGIDPRPYSTCTIETMLSQAGLEPARRRYYDFRLPFLGSISPRLDRIAAAALQRGLGARRTLGQVAEGLLVEAVKR